MTGAAIVVVDTAGTITRWNEDAESLFGYRADEVLGRRVDVIVPPRLREAHWEGFHRAMREPRVKDLAADLPVLCADGETRTFAGRLLVLSDALGEAIGAIAVYNAEGTTGVQPFSAVDSPK